MMRMIFGRGAAGKKDEEAPIVPADPSAASDLAEALHRNKEAIETLEKRQQHIEKKIRNQEATARERVASGDRRGAMLCLRRKKLFEQDLEQILTSRLTLETQIVTLEAAHTQQLAVQAIAGAAKAHRNFSQKLSIGKIDRLLDDIQEQQDLQQEVTQVLAQGLPPLDDVELQRELNALEASEIENRVLETACNAPSVPVDDPALTMPSLLQSLQPCCSPGLPFEPDRREAHCLSSGFAHMVSVPDVACASPLTTASPGVYGKPTVQRLSTHSTSASLSSSYRVSPSSQRLASVGRECRTKKVPLASVELATGGDSFPLQKRASSQATAGCGSVNDSLFSLSSPSSLHYVSPSPYLSTHSHSPSGRLQFQGDTFLPNADPKSHRGFWDQHTDRSGRVPERSAWTGQTRAKERFCFGLRGPTLLDAESAQRRRDTVNEEEQLRRLMGQLGP
ncbi:SNF7 family protein [Toxoplasma gondii ME49]|uniref:SNF7 family protein n=4 Tax=Toxoplasma gondii TaxID=5811 RepID=A0A125YNP3_TOXGV|nr:SNF7 family protein [Toxoplasma gondii ME49]EPT24996.1 SNF7 family protein [Toxoplasma gondii ME49]ESS34297.1 SNF7 family protein [Toxoplasma gondii VEG]KYF49706.1 SNF7 family protein [Toxoplasma gondii ARI]PIM04580.1 SNF7 family protein [Toxoplasma gondii COUG]|eukprot:XP_018634993.1 SNF7 family protein [Toxoplasma gondii ME49]